MINIKKYISLFIVILSLNGCEYKLYNIEANKEYEEVSIKIDDAILYEIKNKKLNAISISIVKDQKILFAKGYGYENKKTKRLADANTIYRVGSVSKLFTDMAIMIKQEDGSVNIDVPINNYLPEFKPNNPYDTPITLRQLMSHRSGLLREPRAGNYFDSKKTSLKETVKSINGSTLIYEPETKIKYSNAAIAVVGYVLEKINNQPYAEIMQKNILNELKMENSSFVPNFKINKRLARGTMWSYDGRSFDAPTFQLGMIPAGSLYSSVIDLSNFLMMIFKNGKINNNQFINEKTLKVMLEPQYSSNRKFGYGIGFRLSDHNDFTKIGHGGAIYGYSTQLSAILEINTGVIISSSVDLTNSITTKLSDYALDLIIAKDRNLPLPDYVKTYPIEKKLAKSLVGKYGDIENNFEITYSNKVLSLITDQLETALYNGPKGIISDSKLIQDSYKIKKTKNGININGKNFAKIIKNKDYNFPSDWKNLIGEFGPDHNVLFIYEDNGKLFLLIEWFEKNKLLQINKNLFELPKNYGLFQGEKLNFIRDENDYAIAVEILNGPLFKRRNIGVEKGKTFKIDPIKPIEIIRKNALKASPPIERSDFFKSDLVELRSLDPSINYDIRYASTNNFMNSVFYNEAKAFMQRDAAKALVAANKIFNELGYGILIHDAYRPWYVTKMFWDATPLDKKIFVADPKNGSRHNRGCAIDLSLVDLKTNKVIEMVGGYDEFTERSFPNYYGGTSEQRYHRSLLREVMESQGFTVYDYEWWHFDYKDWKKYKIENIQFENIQNK